MIQAVPREAALATSQSSILHLRPLIILMLLPTFPEHLKLCIKHKLAKKQSLIKARDME
jgi:hypothetical protein